MMFKPLFQENHDFLTKQVWSFQYHTFKNLSLSFPHSTKEQSDVQTALKRPQRETFNAIIHWFFTTQESNIVFNIIYSFSLLFVNCILLSLKFRSHRLLTNLI